MTLALFDLLNNRREQYVDDWSSGAFVRDEIQNLIAVGYCKACEDILNIDLEEIRDEENGK